MKTVGYVAHVEEVINIEVYFENLKGKDPLRTPIYIDG